MLKLWPFYLSNLVFKLTVIGYDSQLIKLREYVLLTYVTYQSSYSTIHQLPCYPRCIQSGYYQQCRKSNRSVMTQYQHTWHFPPKMERIPWIPNCKIHHLWNRTRMLHILKYVKCQCMYAINWQQFLAH